MGREEWYKLEKKNTWKIEKRRKYLQEEKEIRRHMRKRRGKAGVLIWHTVFCANYKITTGSH
jgi:hypothetical protein